MAELKRSLTLFDMTMIAIGGSIGSGIFLTPATIARDLGAPWLIVAVWVMGGLITLAGALTFSEAAALLPEAGGQYVFLTRAYGGLTGFLFGWAYFLVCNAGGLGALSVAFATYLGFFFPLGPVGTKAAAIIGLLFLTGINVTGVKAGALFSDVFTMLKLAGIAGLVVVGLAMGSPHTTDFSITLAEAPSNLWSALALGMVGVLWSYGGWQHATYASAEIKNPQRTLPLAMTIAAVSVTAIYLLANLAYMWLLPPARMAASPRVAADAISTVLGPMGGSLISIAIFISTFGVVGIYTLTAPRIYYAMAADGVFFRKVAEVHPRFHTPAFAIIFQSLWAVVLILFWGTFENLISYVVFTDWIFFALAGASVIILRRTMPDAPRPYRVPGYPWVPMFFVATSARFVVMTLIEKPAQAWAGLLFLGLGVPVYYAWKRQARTRSPGTGS
ncbi:MAG: amino acid permease [Acidobacteria bacterium]|nr:amino acid permease [Acidobacteriota bacterium]